MQVEVSVNPNTLQIIIVCLTVYVYGPFYLKIITLGMMTFYNQ